MPGGRGHCDLGERRRLDGREPAARPPWREEEREGHHHDPREHTNVEERAVIPAYDAQSIYMIPSMLHDEGLDEIVIEKLNIDAPDGSSQLNVFQLFSHAHQLMTRFDILILHPNGVEELIYTALDYEHPPILQLDPPIILTNGQSLISRATYNNTTNEPVTFGLFSTNEMMIIFGLAYFN